MLGVKLCLCDLVVHVVCGDVDVFLEVKLDRNNAEVVKCIRPNLFDTVYRRDLVLDLFSDPALDEAHIARRVGRDLNQRDDDLGKEIYQHPKKRHRAEKYERDEKHQRRNRAIYG